MTMPTMPQRGDFVRVRTRRWLVEDERSAGDGLTALRLACVDDDAQGEVVEVLWDAELDGSVLKDEGWASVAKLGTDDPSVFSAYLRALRWNTATAADRDLFQAPFRAGIHQDGGSRPGSSGNAPAASAYSGCIKPLPDDVVACSAGGASFPVWIAGQSMMAACSVRGADIPISWPLRLSGA